MDLLERQKAHKAHNLKLRNTVGSGYHDRDTDPTNRSRLVAPQCQNPPLPAIDEHLIAYFDHEYEEAVYFVGEDARVALECLQGWCQKNAPKNVHDPLPGTYRKILKHVPRLAVENGVLKLWLSEWNDFLFALTEEGCGITGAPFEADGTTP